MDAAIEAAFSKNAAAVQTAGESLQILCDRTAAPYFLEGYADEALGRRVRNRNTFFELENGVTLTVTVSEDMYTAAAEDILSGDGQYTLYAADAGGVLVKLLAHGLLGDIRPVLERGGNAIDRARSLSLSVGGKPYLLSSAILPATAGAMVLRCSPDLAAAWSSTVIDGNFTADRLAGASTALFAESPDNAFALYTALGGSFIVGSEDGYKKVSYEDFRRLAETVASVLKNNMQREAPFTVTRLSDLTAEDGFLPLPKASVADIYRTAIDLNGTPLCALPKTAAIDEDFLVLLGRLAYLSDIYLQAPRREALTGGDVAREALYAAVTGGAVCDLSNLFGYGDIPALTDDIANGREPQPALQYYNRMALYGKALSIHEKRLTTK